MIHRPMNGEQLSCLMRLPSVAVMVEPLRSSMVVLAGNTGITAKLARTCCLLSLCTDHHAHRVGNFGTCAAIVPSNY